MRFSNKRRVSSVAQPVKVFPFGCSDADARRLFNLLLHLFRDDRLLQGEGIHLRGEEGQEAEEEMGPGHRP